MPLHVVWPTCCKNCDKKPVKRYQPYLMDTATSNPNVKFLREMRRDAVQTREMLQKAKKQVTDREDGRFLKNEIKTQLQWENALTHVINWFEGTNIKDFKDWPNELEPLFDRAYASAHHS